MKQAHQISILGALLAVFFTCVSAPVQAGNVAWNVSVGGGYGGYGGWRPVAYGPGWGHGWGPGWRGNWGYSGGYYGPYAAYYAPPVVYAPPPVVTYSPPQPVVLAAQPQPAVWYYCAASGKYYPYAQECPTGWQTQAATPPTSNAPNGRPQY